jgi:hypothetical protein
MLDTRLVFAIETTLNEFEEWAQKKPLWQKLGIAAIKGVFTEKLKRNVQATNYNVGNIFNPSLLGDFRVEEARICSILFHKEPYCTGIASTFVDDCNTSLREIWLKGRTLHKSFENSVEGSIIGIRDFKIL